MRHRGWLGGFSPQTTEWPNAIRHGFASEHFCSISFYIFFFYLIFSPSKATVVIMLPAHAAGYLTQALNHLSLHRKRPCRGYAITVLDRRATDQSDHPVALPPILYFLPLLTYGEIRMPPTHTKNRPHPICKKYFWLLIIMFFKLRYKVTNIQMYLPHCTESCSQLDSVRVEVTDETDSFSPKWLVFSVDIQPVVLSVTVNHWQHLFLRHTHSIWGEENKTKWWLTKEYLSIHLYIHQKAPSCASV